MNELRMATVKIFKNLHPSEFMYFAIRYYESAIDYMEMDVPTTEEIMNSMLDYFSLGFSSGVQGLCNTHEMEVYLTENGFDFINTDNVRINSAQIYL